MANTPRDIEEQKWSNWYVLTTSNPKHLEDLIAQANALTPGQYDSYCPYTRLPEESGRTDADSQFSLRAVLRRYDFVRIPKTVSEQQFMATVSEWSRSSVNSILFLRNGDKTNAKVTDGQLNRMRACCDAVLIKPENLSLRDLKRATRSVLPAHRSLLRAMNTVNASSSRSPARRADWWSCAWR